MRIHTTHTRDAALRELHRINRWMIAASVVLTGVLTDVAANAFPGRTVKSVIKAKAPRGHSGHTQAGAAGSASAGAGALAPPKQAPGVASESTSSAESAAARESATAQETEAARESVPAQETEPAQESAPAQESSPAQQAAAEPAQESAPVREPAQESAPVVSGGS
jgi:hypothetical protein